MTYSKQIFKPTIRATVKALKEAIFSARNNILEQTFLTRWIYYSNYESIKHQPWSLSLIHK